MILTDIKPIVISIEDESDISYIKNKYSKDCDIGTNLYGSLGNASCYIVKPLDTISKIANKLNISEDNLIKKLKSNIIFVGQKIDID